MIEFNTNEYIDIYNPAENNYFPIRILKKNENGYNVLLLPNDKQINIYDYQLNTYGYKKIRISEKLLDKLGFKKTGFIYTLENITIWECLIGELKKLEHPYYLYEYNSKHLGYAFLKENEVEKFKKEYNEIDFDSTNHKIMENYFFTNSINDVFAHLLKHMSEKYNYKEFDKIILSNN